MTTTHAGRKKSTDRDPPANYQRDHSHPQPTWVHTDTGLQVGLRRDHRPQGGRMTHHTATQPDDHTWIFEVRPDQQAEIYERLGGDKAGAREHAHEWMHHHPDGRLD